jgi:hypothetical protein
MKNWRKYSGSAGEEKLKKCHCGSGAGEEGEWVTMEEAVLGGVPST